MKQFLRKNIVTFLCFGLLLAGTVVCVVQRQGEINQSISAMEKIQKQCYQDLEDTSEACKTLRGVEDVRELLQKRDSVNTYFDFFGTSFLGMTVIFLPLMVIIPATWVFYQKTKRGPIKESLMRQGYRTYLKSTFRHTYAHIWMLPLFAVCTFFIVCCVTGFQFDYQATITENPLSIVPSLLFFDTLPWSIIVYIGMLLLHSVFYINIAIIAVKKSQNVFVAMLEACLIFIAVEYVSSIGIGALLLTRMFKIPHMMDSFSLLNIWAYMEPFNLAIMVGWILFLILSTSLFIYFNYRKKERFIMEAESD